jgi:hypothetical protein
MNFVDLMTDLVFNIELLKYMDWNVRGRFANASRRCKEISFPKDEAFWTTFEAWWDEEVARQAAREVTARASDPEYFRMLDALAESTSDSECS